MSVEPTDKLTFGWLLGPGRRVDVIHLHWLQGYTDDQTIWKSWLKLLYFSLWLIVARYMLGIRLIWTVHNLYPHEVANPATVRLGRRLVGALAGACVIHSESVLPLVTEELHLVPGRIWVSEHPNWVGIYPNEITAAAARAQLGLPGDQTVFLALGHIRPYKGIPQLIEAFKELAIPAHLVVAGSVSDAGLRYEIETRAADCPNIHLHLVFLPDESLQLYLNACDCLVLPFREVLTSGSAILGMSFARPVIAPAMGCLPTLLGNGAGVLYDAEAADGLAAGIQQALTLDLHTMGKTAFERVRPATWDRFGQQHRDLYRWVLKQR